MVCVPKPFALLLVILTVMASEPSVVPAIWYEAPGMYSLDGMPLGNGHIGAMVYGGIQQERIVLNEATMWSGEECLGRTDQGGRTVREEIQQAFIQGDLQRGHDLTARFQQTREALERIGSHLPVGDLYIDDLAPPVRAERYRRTLDLARSQVTVDFIQAEVAQHRVAFVSHPDKVLVWHVSSDRPHQIARRISLKPWQADPSLESPRITAVGDELLMTGHVVEKRHSNGTVGVRFEVRAVADGGSVAADHEALTVSGANALTLLVSITTDFAGMDHQAVGRARIAAAVAKPFAGLLAAHSADVEPRFARVGMILGDEPGREMVPTDRRLAALINGRADPGLLALFFQFGRYLTLAGSREDSLLPMPLQGLWSDGKAATMGWSDDYHLDINTQQNYWLAEVGNLGECHAPLFSYIRRLSEIGSRSARETWGARGWCAHLTANAWAASPFNHGGAPTMGAWIASHLWDHYRFTNDREFLRLQAYPILRDSALFFLDTMVTDPRTGWLVTCPAYSPENHYLDPVTGVKRTYSLGNLGDAEIVDALFGMVIEGARALDVDAELRTQLESARARLPRPEDCIHADGRLMEWLRPITEGDYARSHRHTHHLLGLFPFDVIGASSSPRVVAAVRATLADKQERLGKEDTEWTRANYMHFFARLQEGDAALRELTHLLTRWTPGRSLLTVSWSDIFCLDGNTAGASGIAEMLLQSQDGAVHLLPALPSAWRSGSFRGLRARGDVEVDAVWREGRITMLRLHSATRRQVTIRYEGRTVDVALGADGDGRYLYESTGVP